MKYKQEERLDIGRRIYDDEITKFDASVQYGISVNCARDYMRLYRDTYSLPPKNSREKTGSRPATDLKPETLEDIQAMTKEELVDALVMARINEARLKKGYIVEGVGAEKKFILLGKKNTK